MVLPRGCGALPPSLQLRHRRLRGRHRRFGSQHGPAPPVRVPARAGTAGSGQHRRARGSLPRLPAPACPGEPGGRGRSRTLPAVDTDEMRARLSRKQGIPNWQLAEPWMKKAAHP